MKFIIITFFIFVIREKSGRYISCWKQIEQPKIKKSNMQHLDSNKGQKNTAERIRRARIKKNC